MPTDPRHRWFRPVILGLVALLLLLGMPAVLARVHVERAVRARAARAVVASSHRSVDAISTISSTSLDAILGVVRPNGIESGYDCETGGRLISVEHADGATLPARFAYNLDPNGNRTELVITGSEVTNQTETYTYDDLDRLIEVEYDDGINPPGGVEYTYDKNGNRTSVTSGSTVTDYTYDAADQLTDIEGLTLTYDANGNRITAGSDDFTYDWNNRLTEATVGSTTATFAYLGDDTRQSKTSGSTSTDYLYDRTSGLPNVLDDGTTSYLHAQGLSSEIDNTTDDATTTLTDGLESVRARADETGAVIGTADWDVWGNLRASSGVSGAFGWTGEQRDSETAYTFLRGRYYSPGSARFLTRDTGSPNAAETQGYNGYAYANGNPVTLTDPSGHTAQGGLAAIGQSIVGIFAYIAAVIECVLHGECRHSRDNVGSGGGSGSGSGGASGGSGGSTGSGSGGAGGSGGDPDSGASGNGPENPFSNGSGGGTGKVSGGGPRPPAPPIQPHGSNFGLAPSLVPCSLHLNSKIDPGTLNVFYFGSLFCRLKLVSIDLEFLVYERPIGTQDWDQAYQVDVRSEGCTNCLVSRAHKVQGDFMNMCRRPPRRFGFSSLARPVVPVAVISHPLTSTNVSLMRHLIRSEVLRPPCRHPPPDEAIFLSCGRNASGTNAPSMAKCTRQCVGSSKNNMGPTDHESVPARKGD